MRLLMRLEVRYNPAITLTPLLLRSPMASTTTDLWQVTTPATKPPTERPTKRPTKCYRASKWFLRCLVTLAVVD